MDASASLWLKNGGDWPPDLNGTDPWLPAYGFEIPLARTNNCSNSSSVPANNTTSSSAVFISDKDDFLTSSDVSEVFLQGTNHYVYLETIQEETSDDLRSENSDFSDRSKLSPMGWLATDSESGSVIRLHTLDLDEVEQQNEYESDREVACPAKRRRKHLQQLEEHAASDDEISCHSLSRSSSLLQFESLEKQCQQDLSSSSPSVFSSFSYDSLERTKAIKFVPCSKRDEANSPDSLESRPLYLEEEEEEEEDVVDYYKTLKVDFPKKQPSSDESEDSEETVIMGSFSQGSVMKTWRSLEGLSNSCVSKAAKIVSSSENLSEDSGYSDTTMTNFSKSIPNVMVIQQTDQLRKRTVYKTRVEFRNEHGFEAYDGEVFSSSFSGSSHFGISYHDLSSVVDNHVSKSPLIERFMMRNAAAGKRDDEECCASKIKTTDAIATSASEPNLLCASDEISADAIVSSLPKDLNLHSEQKTSSIATKNFDLADLVGEMPKPSRYHRAQYGDKIRIRLKYDSSSISSENSDNNCSGRSFAREGSYLEAMSHSIDMSGDEKSSVAKMKAISECSIQQANDDDDLVKLVFSTPNLCTEPEKGNKGVHFSPVVSQMSNWRDDDDDSLSNECSSSSSESLAMPRYELKTKSQPELHSVDLDTSTDENSSLVIGDRRRRRVVKSVLDDHNSLPSMSGGHVEESRKQNRVESVGVRAPSGNVAAAMATSSMMSQSGTLNNQQQQQQPSKTAMKSQKGGKFGGFFSRIASFRFSNRGGKKSAHQQPQQQQQHKKSTSMQEISQNGNATGQRLATKDDYIYIPLKGPLPNNNNNNNDTRKCVSGKPPLPKMPPRVVGTCAKTRRTKAAAEAAAAPFADQRRTIDSCGLPRPMEPPMGLIETDLDTEVTVITSGGPHAKTRSLMNLGGAEAPQICLAAPNSESHYQQEQHNHHHHRPHKSMEFLLDKQNLKVVEPPENELQKGGERVMSEHQLRVQRSLQKLNVPDWYKASQVPREGFLLNKNKGSRWQGTGTGSKTTSLSSLQGSNTQSPVMLSPSNAGLMHQPFVRWSTSKLNSTASSPCASTRSSFNASRQPNGSISPSSLRSSFNYRQPYLGWRSQERLTSRPRTPAERLANTILMNSHQPGQMQQQEASPEIQTSIKEVTSAIVHYVSGLQPESGREHSYDSQETASQRSRSVSPRSSHQRLCWLESSFVGSRPLESPQTPVTLTADTPSPILPVVPPSSTAAPLPNSLKLDLQQSHNHDVCAVNTGGSRKPSPSSTTLEDVLDSLLGLPTSTRAPSPSLQETASANTSPVKRAEASEQFRRRSEGSEPHVAINEGTGNGLHRRASLNNSSPALLRCRYSRCNKTASAASHEASFFKNCHNCSYTYCSRGCRRAHWEKHRKTCLFSRVGTLCRQIINAAKEQEGTLHTLSVVARRGYLSRGLGAVKIFFECPEAADKFLKNGLDTLGGDPTYVRWSDLLPSEMGPQLYAELVRMCQSYNPDTRLVLYVSVCVVSEAPAAGAVKWERQLVSRCGKLRLSKKLPVMERDVDNPETLILTCAPIDFDVQRSRQKVFESIQRHLVSRGVSLQCQYPEVYHQLCSYVSAPCTRKFAAVTIYPKDIITGKTFMCIIMPDVKPESVDKVCTAGVRVVKTVDVVLDDETDFSA